LCRAQTGVVPCHPSAGGLTRRNTDKNRILGFSTVVCTGQGRVSRQVSTAAASVADHLWLMGRDHDTHGNPLPGSHIVETYDLIERDLCWHPEIITHPRFVEFVREVKDRFRSL